MTHSAVLRATSLATSGALLAAIAIAAVTMTFTLRANFPAPDTPAVTIETLPQTPPPPPARPVRLQPPPTSPDAIPTQTELAPLDAQDDLVEIAIGPTAADPAPIITRPQWVRRPSGLEAYYPRRALERGITGDVVLNCMVSVTGHLDCRVASETPAGWAFGDAALRIARDHRMVPAARDGIAVEGRYTMRVPFRVD